MKGIRILSCHAAKRGCAQSHRYLQRHDAAERYEQPLSADKRRLTHVRLQVVMLGPGTLIVNIYVPTRKRVTVRLARLVSPF
jgi:hypothetical protein